MKLSQMKQLLAERRIHLTKSLGQNFLHDANQLRRIMNFADIQAGDQVLEIGPGLGPLTELLVAKAGHVLAIEIDQHLFTFLQERFGSNPNLTLVHADALKFLRHHPRDWSEWKLVSNLPYAVASPILVHLAQDDRGPARMITTVQLEVAGRLVAKAGQENYGLLSLLIQARYVPRDRFTIPASCFYPEPDVDSACVLLQRRTEPLLAAAELPVFRRVVKRAFSQRRKMMLKLLKTDWPAPRLQAAFDALGLPGQIRAEAVTLEQFVQLTQRLHQDSAAPARS